MSEPEDHREDPFPELEAIRRAWLQAPPEPDLLSFVTPELRAHTDRLIDLIRFDALERRRRGLWGDRPWLEHYRALLPEQMGSGAPLAATIEALERAIGEAPPTGAGASWMPPTEQPTPALRHETPQPVWEHGHAKGESIGAYTLKKRLGRGGFGEVWLAERRRPNMTVAIKVLHRGATDKRSRARFEAEAQALALLDHPCIASIHEAGLTESGEPFIAMEYVEGKPLTTYADSRRLSLEQRLELMSRVCEAVQHAHSRGLIHRDLKPDNIMVTEVRRDPKSLEGRDRLSTVSTVDDVALVAVPKVLDFGLAKALNRNIRLSDQTLTEDLGKLMGTLEYMAPEQTTHEPLAVDTRADIFAMGIMLYELITGLLPLPREELVNRAIDEVVRRVRGTVRASPSTRFSSLDAETAARTAYARGEMAPDRLSRILRGRLRHLAGTALRLEPERRFSSAAAFARDIGHYLRGEPYEEAAAEPLRQKVWLAVRRHPLPWAAATLLLLSLIGGITGTSFGLAEAQRQEARALRETEAARGSERRTKEYLIGSSAQIAAAEDPGLAVLILRELGSDASEGAQGLAARVMLSSISHAAMTDLRLVGHSDRVQAASWSPDGRRIVTGSYDNTARVWNADGTGTPIVLNGHAGYVTAALWSPDGRRIVTASSDRTARVWNADGTGTPIVLSGHTGYVTAASWSPDGRRIVTWSDDGTARVWNADGTGTPIVLNGHTKSVQAASWSPDGRRIVTGSYDNTAHVWNADGTGTPIVLNGHASWVTAASWSPDGRRIVTGSYDRTARVWNADGTGTPIVLSGHTDDVRAASWSPDGRRIVTGSVDSTARVWNADGTGTPIVLHHTGWVLAASWSPDGRRIVSGHGTVRVWNADGTGTPIVLIGHTRGVTAASWSPDGRRIVTGSDDRTAHVWNVDGTGTPIVLNGHADSVHAAWWSPDGRRIVTGSWDRTAHVWNADGTGTPIVLNGHTRGVEAASWSPDGRRIVTGSLDDTARVWNADGTGTPIVLSGHTDDVRAASWSPDGRRIVTGSDDNTARVWNADGTGTPIVLNGHTKSVHAASWSPDGRRIVTGSWDRTARVWNADGTGTPIVLAGHTRFVRAASWSPDGRRIVTGSDDGSARVWNADGTGTPIVLEGHTAVVKATSWSPDGRRIVTGGGTVLVWNADGTGTPIVLKGHTGPVEAASWSPDGCRIVTGSSDNTARVWLTNWPALREILWTRTHDVLRPSERVRYLAQTPGEAEEAYQRDMERVSRGAR